MPELIPAAPGSPEWQAARRTGVTATDIVTILGLSSCSSPYSLYWQKMGQVPEAPDSDRFRLGRELEGYVVERWIESRDSIDLGSWDGGLYRHNDRRWQMATPDRVMADSVLEVKTWADADKPAWGQGCRDGVAGLRILDDQMPPAVRAQVLWQMDVMGVAAGHVGVVFLPSGEFRSYTIEHDGHGMTAPPVGARFLASDQQSAAYADEMGVRLCDVCNDQALMRAAGEEFMQRLQLELPAPDPDASAATLAAVRARFTRQPDKAAEVDGEIFEAWLQTRKVISEYEYDQRRLESQLREQAGEASVLTVDGQPVARRIVGDAQVKAHTRHSDYIKRIAPKEADDGA